MLERQYLHRHDMTGILRNDAKLSAYRARGAIDCIGLASFTSLATAALFTTAHPSWLDTGWLCPCAPILAPSGGRGPPVGERGMPGRLLSWTTCFCPPNPLRCGTARPSCGHQPFTGTAAPTVAASCLLSLVACLLAWSFARLLLLLELPCLLLRLGCCRRLFGLPVARAWAGWCRVPPPPFLTCCATGVSTGRPFTGRPDRFWVLVPPRNPHTTPWRRCGPDGRDELRHPMRCACKQAQRSGGSQSSVSDTAGLACQFQMEKTTKRRKRDQQNQGQGRISAGV